ncbi:sigma-70 family RNA polymerase sigma factor [Pseudobacillus badius]|uniref:sigma-70 family RNA polymerase sigma factor n=1 Tax=Bacillus badius TaxID=1455 RepID=UPI0024A4A58D|nr:sigma-70 family RNA polymerase sigma factor [Bacillus badius]GLY09585.1 positive control factor [Bacillus badius]
MKNGAINEDVSMRVLLYQYRQSLREARKMLLPFDKEELTEQEQADKTLINGMISDLEYAIEWLKVGRNPDTRRGIDKSGVYVTDPLVIETMPAIIEHQEERELSQSEKEMIEDALCSLSAREKDAFILVRVEGMTFEYAAELLGVKKGAVQSYVDRAEKKIEQRKLMSLFLVS